MLVINSAVVPTIADLKTHGKNLLKTLEIAHYAFIVSDKDNHGHGIPHFAFKSSHVQEMMAIVLGFKTYAALQNMIKEYGIDFSSSAHRDMKESSEAAIKRALSLRITNLAGTDNLLYGNFLGKYFIDYMLQSKIIQNNSIFTLEPVHRIDLTNYLPLLKYLRVQPFSTVMRKVVEDSYTFNLMNAPLDHKELSTADHFPLSGWIQVAVLNNLIEESVDGHLAGFELIKLPVQMFFLGTPRISQKTEIFNFLESTSVIGTEYYVLSEEKKIWTITPQKEKEDTKVGEYELIFELMSRLKAIINNQSPVVATDAKSYNPYLMRGGNYQISAWMNELTAHVVKARIYEATEYFLTTSREHLSDLNPVLHLEKTEALLSTRHATVNELVWRRQVCDYAENMVNAAKYFFSQCAVGLDELDLKKMYFNDDGFLMFDYDHELEFYMYSLGRRVKLSPLDFSIFFNVFANVIYAKSEQITKLESKHMLSMSYLMFLLLEKIIANIPSLRFMQEIFMHDEYSEIFNVLLRRFNLVESKVEYGYIEYTEILDDTKKTGVIYTTYPQSLGEEYTLLSLLYKNHRKELSALSLIENVKGYSIGDDLKIGSPDKTKTYEAMCRPIEINTEKMNSAIEIRIDEQVEILRDTAAYGEDGEIMSFFDLMSWLTELFHKTPFAKTKAELDKLKEDNCNMYVILNYALNQKGWTRNNKDTYKEISVNCLKCYI